MLTLWKELPPWLKLLIVTCILIAAMMGYERGLHDGIQWRKQHEVQSHE
jgi:hypothetical protein